MVRVCVPRVWATWVTMAVVLSAPSGCDVPPVDVQCVLLDGSAKVRGRRNTRIEGPQVSSPLCSTPSSLWGLPSQLCPLQRPLLSRTPRSLQPSPLFTADRGALGPPPCCGGVPGFPAPGVHLPQPSPPPPGTPHNEGNSGALPPSVPPPRRRPHIVRVSRLFMAGDLRDPPPATFSLAEAGGGEDSCSTGGGAAGRSSGRRRP